MNNMYAQGMSPEKFARFAVSDFLVERYGYPAPAFETRRRWFGGYKWRIHESDRWSRVVERGGSWVVRFAGTSWTP